MASKVYAAVAAIFGWSPREVGTSRETAWLDGVRGVAAFLVLMSHYSMEWLTPFSDAPFGATVLKTRNHDSVWYHEEGERLWEIWRLPILRVFMCSGSAQVAVFFVLSGFVLSWSPLASVRDGDYDKLGRSLGSSTIRRWFRLYLPCALVSIAYLVHKIITYSDGFAAAFEQIWRYIVGTEQWANPFETLHITQFTAGHPFNYVMWTIPFEFGGSIFVYVTLLGLGRITNFYRRVAATTVVSLYALVSLYWGYWLFGSGLALADYVRHGGGFRKLSQGKSAISHYAWVAVFILGLLLLGYPPPSDDWYSSPGYEWMDHVPLPPGWKLFVGSGRFWWGLGGILVVASSCHLTFIRKFFELAIIQHLGRISFMLYLIHILVDVVVAKPLRQAIYERFTTQEFKEIYNGNVYITTPWMNFLVHCVLLATSVPIVMILAHFLEVYVDRPCTNFGKWLDDKLLNGMGERKIALKEAEGEHLLPASYAAGYEMDNVTRS